jgi:hypothetical protein
MMLRVIIWIILLFIAVKIAGSLVRYIRKIMTPNRRVVDAAARPKEPYTNVEDIPYVDVPDQKKE